MESKKVLRIEKGTKSFILAFEKEQIEVPFSKLIAENFKYPTDFTFYFCKILGIDTSDVDFDISPDAEAALNALMESNRILF